MASAEWRSVEHVANATIEARSGLREGYVAPEGLRGGAKNGRGPVRYRPKIGDRYGDLVIESVAGKRWSSVLWLLRCTACGGAALRTTGYLNYAVRNGGTPTCLECKTQLYRGRSAERLRLLSEAYRRQYVDRGTLWLDWQTRSLETGIREDLEAAFGELPDPDEGRFRRAIEHGSLSLDAGFPWSHGDVDRAKDAWDRHHNSGSDGRPYDPTHDGWMGDPIHLTPEEREALLSIEEVPLLPDGDGGRIRNT